MSKVLEIVGPTFSRFRPFLSYLSVATPVLRIFMTSLVRFSMGRQLFVDFKVMPTPSLDLQVALNLGETAPLSRDGLTFPSNNVIEVSDILLRYYCVIMRGTYITSKL